MKVVGESFSDFNGDSNSPKVLPYDRFLRHVS